MLEFVHVDRYYWLVVLLNLRSRATPRS